MKKFLLSLFLVSMFLTAVQAQTFVRLKQGTASDTIHQSQTLYSSTVNLNVSDLQAVVIGVKTDAVSGSPDTKYVLQRSNDAGHWLSMPGDTLSYSATAYQQINVNPFYGAYARVVIYTGAGAQKSKMWITLKSSTIR